MTNRLWCKKSFRSLGKLFAVLAFLPAATVQAGHPWVVLDGHQGPGRGKQIVLIAADDEYRSEELIPQLAKILAKRHGFRCTVLFAIDRKDGTINPDQKDNIPGLSALKTADLLVLFARFCELPDAQMKQIIEYTNSGRPIMGLRTATHAFNYTKHKNSPYAKYSFRSLHPPGGFGRLVLGETWVKHYGHHKHESTRGLIANGMKQHPIVRGVKDIWGPSDVYGISTLSGDSKPLIMGQVLTGMRPTDAPHPTKKLTPVAWIKTYTGTSGKPARVFTTTMGHGGDLKNEGFRRLLVNACYWCQGMEKKIAPQGNVDLVGHYDPNPIGVGKSKKGRRPSDYKLD